jgi:hypothetical protein
MVGYDRPLVVAHIIFFKIYSLASIGKLFPNNLAEEEEDNQSLIKRFAYQFKHQAFRMDSCTRPKG